MLCCLLSFCSVSDEAEVVVLLSLLFRIKLSLPISFSRVPLPIYAFVLLWFAFSHFFDASGDCWGTEPFPLWCLNPFIRSVSCFELNLALVRHFTTFAFPYSSSLFHCFHLLFQMFLLYTIVLFQIACIASKKQTVASHGEQNCTLVAALLIPIDVCEDIFTIQERLRQHRCWESRHLHFTSPLTAQFVALVRINVRDTCVTSDRCLRACKTSIVPSQQGTRR